MCFLYYLYRNLYFRASELSLTKISLFLQYLLRRASLTESDAFTFLRADNEDCITYSGFCEALRQVCCSIHSLLNYHSKSSFNERACPRNPGGYKGFFFLTLCSSI
jgi:hypothetical protein